MDKTLRGHDPHYVVSFYGFKSGPHNLHWPCQMLLRLKSLSIKARDASQALQLHGGNDVLSSALGRLPCLVLSCAAKALKTECMEVFKALQKFHTEFAPQSDLQFECFHI